MHESKKTISNQLLTWSLPLSPTTRNSDLCFFCTPFSIKTRMRLSTFFSTMFLLHVFWDYRCPQIGRLAGTLFRRPNSNISVFYCSLFSTTRVKSKVWCAFFRNWNCSCVLYMKRVICHSRLRVASTWRIFVFLLSSLWIFLIELFLYVCVKVATAIFIHPSIYNNYIDCSTIITAPGDSYKCGSSSFEHSVFSLGRLARAHIQSSLLFIGPINLQNHACSVISAFVRTSGKWAEFSKPTRHLGPPLTQI